VLKLFTPNGKIRRMSRGQQMPARIAKLTEKAETAQADYEICLEVYELCSDADKIRLVPHLTHFLMRRDETLATLSLAIRAPQK
jgi:hypothetical protein